MREHVLDVRRGRRGRRRGRDRSARLRPGRHHHAPQQGPSPPRRTARSSGSGSIPSPATGQKNEDEEARADRTRPRRRASGSSRACRTARTRSCSSRPERDLAQTTLATLQHALLRGIEAVFQLEEGEILAEPMPDARRAHGFLALRGDRGRRRRAHAPGRRARAPRRGRAQGAPIMHFAVTDRLACRPTPTGLVDAPGTACVAACYRCLMSYFNQPDHELHRPARRRRRETLLLRLARGTTTRARGAAPRASADARRGRTTRSCRWLALARGRELPAPDAEPLVVGGAQVAARLAEPLRRCASRRDRAGHRRRARRQGLRGRSCSRRTKRASWPEAFDDSRPRLGHARR